MCAGETPAYIIENMSLSSTPAIDIENEFPIRAVFTGLHEASVRKKAAGEPYDTHLELIESSLLGPEEEGIWDEYQAATTRKDFDALQKAVGEYRLKLHDTWGTIPDPKRNNKAIFIAYVINKMLVKRVQYLGLEK